MDAKRKRMRLSDNLLLSIKKEQRMMSRKVTPKSGARRSKISTENAESASSPTQVNLKKDGSPFPQKTAMQVSEYDFSKSQMIKVKSI